MYPVCDIETGIYVKLLREVRKKSGGREFSILYETQDSRNPDSTKLVNPLYDENLALKSGWNSRFAELIHDTDSVMQNLIWTGTDILKFSCADWEQTTTVNLQIYFNMEMFGFLRGYFLFWNV